MCVVVPKDDANLTERSYAGAQLYDQFYMPRAVFEEVLRERCRLWSTSLTRSWYMYAGPVIEADQIRTDAIVSRREPNVTDRGPPVDPRIPNSFGYLCHLLRRPPMGRVRGIGPGWWLFLISAHFQHFQLA